MFYGVMGQPFFDLEPFLDLSGLDAVTEEVTAFLASYRRLDMVAFSRDQEVHPDLLHLNPYEFYMSHHAPGLDIPGLRFLNAFHQDTLPLGYAIRLRGMRVPSAEGLEPESNSYDLPAAADLPVTMAFLHSLPLKGLGRTSIYYTAPGMDVPCHRDYAVHPGFNNQFIYLNPLLKPFYVVGQDGKRHQITSRASLFNPGDFHGMERSQRACFSIRVNGFFTDDFLDRTKLHEHVGNRRG